MIQEPIGVLAVLCCICAFFFLAETHTKWKLWNYFPPLIFIYITPVIFSNILGVLPTSSPTYSFLSENIIPFLIIILLMNVEVISTLKKMGSAVGVMLFGTLGVAIGAIATFYFSKNYLPGDIHMAFGMLTASWTGGTSNLISVGAALEASEEMYGISVLADNLIYLFWLPLMIQSKSFAKFFNRMTKAKNSLPTELSESTSQEKKEVSFVDFIYIFSIGFGGVFLSKYLSLELPEVQPFLSSSTYKILISTSLGILLSFIPAVRNLPSTRALAIALVYLFVARTGAATSLDSLTSASVPFIIAATVWIFIHGAFLVLGARIFRVDVSTAAVASAANIGGVASTPIVAAYHNPAIVPAGILLALLGQSIGNYLGILTSILCQAIS